MELDKILEGVANFYNLKSFRKGSMGISEAKQALTELIDREVAAATEKVDRFEVIDDTGRAYVKGSIYGSPVSVELSYQDDGRTLKVFVKPSNNDKETAKRIGGFKGPAEMDTFFKNGGTIASRETVENE